MLMRVARDISERRQAQALLKHMAHYDSLTGLPNRTLFFQTLADAIETGARQELAHRGAVHRAGPLQGRQRFAGPGCRATSCCASSARGWCVRAPARHRRPHGRRRVRADPDHDARQKKRTPSTPPTKCARRCACRST
jgi:hypothetical protein